MSKLSLDGVQFLIKNCMSKTPLSVILQAIHAKLKHPADKNTDKISQQLSVSCGNLHILALIPVALKEKLKANGEQYTVSAYDIIKVTSCKLNSTNDKTIIIIKDMSIIKTGLTSKIGNPLYYDDCNKNGNFPIIKVENTIIPGAKEESKESPRISSAIMRKSGICMSEIDEDDYAPIKSLNTMNPDWIILAKVTAKTDLREFNSRDGGKGKLFNFDLMDIHGDQINVTCFNKAVDKFYDLVQQGKVYKVSRGSVRPANKRFTAIKNDFSIILDDKAQVELVEDSGKSKFKDSAFSFSKISEISTFGITRTVDFLGIIFEDLGIKVITTKAGIERRIRTLTLIDDSKVDADEEVNLAINIGIWGELGENLNAKPGDILAFKNLKASEFRGGIQLNNFGADLIFTKDSLKQVKEAHMLIRWYRELSIKNIKNISDGDGSSDSFSKSEHVQ